MTTVVTADNERRICIQGAKTGEKYLVKETEGGWWVAPAPGLEAPVRPLARNRRAWAASRLGLNQHLQRLADHGLRIERAENAKQPVPPCRI